MTGSGAGDNKRGSPPEALEEVHSEEEEKKGNQVSQQARSLLCLLSLRE